MAWGSNVNTIDRSIGVYQGNPEIGKFGAEERKRKYYGKVSEALRGINGTLDGKSDEELQAMKADLMQQLQEIQNTPIDEPVAMETVNPTTEANIPRKQPLMNPLQSQPAYQQGYHPKPAMAPLFSNAPRAGFGNSVPNTKPLFGR